MGSDRRSKLSLRERAAVEAKEFAIIAVYLLVCFLTLAFFKAAILQAHEISYAPFGLATAKALICAKFISVGRMIRLGERVKTHLALIWPTLHRSLMFLLLLLVLNAVEEIVVGTFHHRAVTDSIADIAGGTFLQLLAASFVMLLILIPFFAFRALGEVVGEENLVRVFLHGRHRAEKAYSRSTFGREEENWRCNHEGAIRGR